MTISLDSLRSANTREELHSALMGVLGTIASQLDAVTARGESDGAKLEVYDRSIGDLRGALAEVRASLGAEALRDLQGPEAELRSFVGRDGRIRWTGRATSEELWQDGLLDTERDLGDWHVEAKRLHGALSLARVAHGLRWLQVAASIHESPARFQDAATEALARPLRTLATLI